MSLEPSSPSLLGHPLCLPARAFPPSSRAPSPDLPPTHSPSPGLGAADELWPWALSRRGTGSPGLPGFCGAKLVCTPTGCGLWNRPASHLTDRDTEAQTVTRPVISEAGFKLTSAGLQASALLATRESVTFGRDCRVNNKPLTLRSAGLTRSSRQLYEGLSYYPDFTDGKVRRRNNFPKDTASTHAARWGLELRFA